MTAGSAASSASACLHVRTRARALAHCILVLCHVKLCVCEREGSKRELECV